jgi:hypothetical protein
MALLFLRGRLKVQWAKIVFRVRLITRDWRGNDGRAIFSVFLDSISRLPSAHITMSRSFGGQPPTRAFGIFPIIVVIP